MFSLFKRRMPDNEVRAVAEMQKKIDFYEDTVSRILLMMSDLPMTFPDCQKEFPEVSWMIRLIKVTRSDKDELQKQVRDLTIQLNHARQEIESLTKMIAEPDQE